MFDEVSSPAPALSSQYRRDFNFCVHTSPLYSDMLVKLTFVALLLVALWGVTQAFRFYGLRKIGTTRLVPLRSETEKKGEGLDLDLEQMFEVFEAAEKGEGDIGDLQLTSAEERQKDNGGISNSMREKLLKEAASNDPNFSAGPVAGNPILIISAIIGALVIVGGRGYFY